MRDTFDYKTFTAVQLASWPMAKANYDALDSVELKSFVLEKGTTYVQFNPERYRSTAAKIDAKSIAERPCFLCEQNRPAEQHRFSLNENFELLVNPFPIFRHHYTIPSYAHQPQRIQGNVQSMLELAKQLKPLVVFYNGPFCGASAPDHFHFQAFEPTEHIEGFDTDSIHKTVWYASDELEVYSIKNHVVNCIILKSASLQRISKALDQFY